jgi:hypothetical protein
MRGQIVFALVALVLCVPWASAAEKLDECAADMRQRLGQGRGTLKNWYPVCQELRKQEQRRAEAEEKHRQAGAQNPAKAAESDLRLQNCMNASNPTWEGKRVSTEWWEAHCRWFTGQPGAQRPAAP